jgi:hypothetical protein
VAFTAFTECQKLSNDIWNCDNGACCQYCNNKEFLYNAKEMNENIVIGNGKTMRATTIGSLRRNMIQLDETTTEITIHNVKYVPELYVNLFRVNKALKKEFKISNQGAAISFSKNHISITLDRIYLPT